MIDVSKSFKEKIKNDVRNIKGFVEVIYKEDKIKERARFKIKNWGDYKATIIDNSTDEIEVYDLKDNIRYNAKYATFDDNLKLDGSYMLLAKYLNNPDKGVICGYIYENNSFFDPKNNKKVEGPISIIIDIEDGVYDPDGLTIYFRDGRPLNMNIETSYTDYGNYNFIEINEKNNEKYFLEDNTFYTELIGAYNHIKIDIFDWYGESKRPIVSEIDFGISRMYQNSDLIDFSIDEEIDLLNIETPTNECTVNIVGAEKFNILVKDSYIKYLDNNVRIKPYIGLNTGEKMEYVPCGVYYLSNYTSDMENNKVSLTGLTIMDKFCSNENYIVPLDSEYSILPRSIYYPLNAFFRALEDTYTEYKWDTLHTIKSDINYRIIVNDTYLKNTNFIDFIKLYCLIHSLIFTTNRQGMLKIGTINKTSNDKLLLDNLKTRPKIEQIDNYNDIDFITDGGSVEAEYSDDDYEIYSEVNQLELTSTKMFYVTKHDAHINDIFEKNTNISSTEGVQVYCTYPGAYVSCFEIRGSVGEKVDFHLVGYKANKIYNDNVLLYSYKINNDKSKKISLTIPFNIDSKYYESISKDILSNSYQNKMSFEYFGDPSIEPGDMELVETGYGFRNIIVTHSTLKFDGGLTGTIEGVFNEK